MRVSLISFLVALITLNGVAQSPKRETVVGTVLAYNHIYNLMLMTNAQMLAAFIVRTRASDRKPSQLIEVRYRYWAVETSKQGGFPEELMGSARAWRFKLVSAGSCGPLQDAIPSSDVNTGQESGERFPVWKLLPGAEGEKLPFGTTLPCYELRERGYTIAR